MKITKIEYSMTRQVTNFHPASYSIAADLTENDNFEQCCKELQRMVIRVLYKDQPVMRDSLIKQLVDLQVSFQPVKTEIKSTSINKKPIQENTDFLNQPKDEFPDFSTDDNA